MIVANLATYPARRAGLANVVHTLAPQVDKLNIVLNEYLHTPRELEGIQNLNCIIPHEDTKDVGKFYPEVSDADYVFLVDDDVEYPEDFIDQMMRKFKSLPAGNFLGGLHTSIYQKPDFGFRINQMRRYARFFVLPHKIAAFRNVVSFNHDLDASMFVDQVATNSAIIRGRDMPSYKYMRDSQKFVDVRLALWCFEQGIETVALPRKSGWLATEPDDHSIFLNFTQKHHSHVAKEIWKFAFKKPYVGKSIHKDQSDLSTRSVAGMK